MVEATVKVNVALPVPVMDDDGLKLAVTPDGSVDVIRVTAESNPPLTVLVMVEEPVLPCTTETDPGEALRLNPGVATVPASALRSPVPLGLPQPVAKSYPVVAE